MAAEPPHLDLSLLLVSRECLIDLGQVVRIKQAGTLDVAISHRVSTCFFFTPKRQEQLLGRILRRYTAVGFQEGDSRVYLLASIRVVRLFPQYPTGSLAVPTQPIGARCIGPATTAIGGTPRAVRRAADVRRPPKAPRDPHPPT